MRKVLFVVARARFVFEASQSPTRQTSAHFAIASATCRKQEESSTGENNLFLGCIVDNINDTADARKYGIVGCVLMLGMGRLEVVLGLVR